MRSYSNEFFDRLGRGSQRSARVVVPLVLELLRPKSVVDVGCGTGSWLSVFRDRGVDDFLGVDGAWVDPEQLVIPREKFRAVDLEQPLDVGRSFDLALSLEVAEHLPKTCADRFVDSLARLAPAVLFSAAIPFQGGTNHVNEQWQDWWVERFRERDLRPIDCVRPRVWRNPEVDVWYAQNTILYAREELIERSPALRQAWERTDPERLSLIHPRSMRRMSTEYAKKTLSLRRLFGWRMKGIRRKDYRREEASEQVAQFPPESGAAASPTAADRSDA